MEFELRKNENNVDYEKQTISETNSEIIELGRKIARSYNSVQIKQFFAKKILQFFQTPIYSNFQSRQNHLTEELDEIKMNLFAVKEETNNSYQTIQPTLETSNRLQSTTRLKVVIQTESNIHLTMNSTSKKNFDIKSPRVKSDPKIDFDNDKAGLVERKEKKLQSSSQKFIGKFGSIAEKNKLHDDKRILSNDLNDEGDKLASVEDTKPVNKLKSKKNNPKFFSKKEAGEEESDIKKSTVKLETMKKGRFSTANEEEKKDKDESKKSIKYLHPKKVIKKKRAKDANLNESGDFKTLENENNEKECQQYPNQEIVPTLNNENQRYAEENIDPPADCIDIDHPVDCIDNFTYNNNLHTNNNGIDPPNDFITLNLDNNDSFSGLTEKFETNCDVDELRNENNKSNKVRDISYEYESEENNIDYSKSIAENYMTNFN